MIFITGHGDIAMAVRAMKAGAVDFLPKPFDDNALLDAVAQAIAAQRRDGGPRQAPECGRRSRSKPPVRNKRLESLDQVEQPVDVGHFVQIADAADPPGFVPHAVLVECGHDDHRDGRPARFQLALQVEAGHAGEVNVQQQTRRRSRWWRGEILFRRSVGIARTLRAQRLVRVP